MLFACDGRGWMPLVAERRGRVMHIAVTLLAVMSALPLTPVQEAKVDRLEKKLMAPCCYSQTIKDHMSDVAAEMRDEVTEFVVEGKDETEILTYYRKKYGETILAEPDGWSGRILIGIPALVTVLASGLVWWLVRRYAAARGRVLSPTGAVALAGVPGEMDAMRMRIRAEVGED